MQDLAASLKSIWERDQVKFLRCLKITFMLFSGNRSNDIFGGVISTYFVYAAVLHFLYLSFGWGLLC